MADVVMEIVKSGSPPPPDETNNDPNSGYTNYQTRAGSHMLPTLADIQQVEYDINNTYSYFNNYYSSGQYSYEQSNYIQELLGNPIDSLSPAPATPPTSPVGNNLLNTLKNNADTVSKSVNDITKALHENNFISSRNVQAIENLGANIQRSLSLVSHALNLGNATSDVFNKLFNHHSKFQTVKNQMQIEDIEFKSKGLPTLVDSQGNQIVPREAQATHNAEKALETKVGNSVNWGNVMDSVTNANNEINDEGINLFDQLVNIHKLDETSIQKIDDEVKKINWGASNV
jgi:hypothetical protein